MAIIPEDADFPFHRQDFDMYYGAAGAQIVLHSLGVGLPGLKQYYLFNLNSSDHSDGNDWGMAPDTLRMTLNAVAPAGKKTFGNFKCSSEDAVSRAIVWSIYRNKTAVIALVFEGKHWLVVCGCDVAGDPMGPGDTDYQIKAFYVKDPLPPIDPKSAAALPTHHDDDECGTGQECGHRYRHISYSTWRQQYMTAVGVQGTWKGKFVAVYLGDKQTAGWSGKIIMLANTYARNLKVVAQRVTKTSRRSRLKRSVPSSGRYTLISPEDAKARAVEGLRQYGLYSEGKEPWASLLVNSRPGAPIKVQRGEESSIEGYYYIVPMLVDGGAPVAVKIDALSGDYEEAVAVPERRMVAVSKSAEHWPVHTQPAFMWTPSVESFSPFYPFRISDPGTELLYERIDGKSFRKINKTVLGA